MWQKFKKMFKSMVIYMQEFCIPSTVSRSTCRRGFLVSLVEFTDLAGPSWDLERVFLQIFTIFIFLVIFIKFTVLVGSPQRPCTTFLVPLICKLTFCNSLNFCNFLKIAVLTQGFANFRNFHYSHENCTCHWAPLRSRKDFLCSFHCEFLQFS